MHLVTGIFFLVVGVIASVWGFQAAEQINLEQRGNEIIASLDPTFIKLFIIGFFLIGLGVGQATSTHTIYNLEKQLTREHSPITLLEAKNSVDTAE